jgi:hypothetical protein
MNSIEEAVVKVVCNESPVSHVGFSGLKRIADRANHVIKPPNQANDAL